MAVVSHQAMVSVMDSVRSRLAEIARSQFGAFATWQAEDANVARKELLRLRDQGEVVRLFRGVYAFTIFPDGWNLRAMAALLAAGASAALSHHAAAFALDLPYLGLTSHPELELVVPRGRRRWKLPLTIHESLHIRPIDVVEAGPLRVTSPEWTLCSLTGSGLTGSSGRSCASSGMPACRCQSRTCGSSMRLARSGTSTSRTGAGGSAWRSTSTRFTRPR